MGEPDQLDPSVFDDAEETNRQSSDESRISVLVHAAAVSAAGDADIEGDRCSSMASAYSAVDHFAVGDVNREQSWEYTCRESSLYAAPPSAAGLPLRANDPATTAAVFTDEEQTSRKRKAPSSKSVNRRKRAPVEPPSPTAPSSDAEDVDEDFIPVPEEDIRDDDILGGRGGLSNHHVGNKRFRKIVADMKEMYRETGVKTDKTALSRAIVKYVRMKGGRFLIKNPDGQVGWRVMTKAESRKKTSQALRETKQLKWTLSASEGPT